MASVIRSTDSVWTHTYSPHSKHSPYTLAHKLVCTLTHPQTYSLTHTYSYTLALFGTHICTCTCSPCTQPYTFIHTDTCLHPNITQADICNTATYMVIHSCYIHSYMFTQAATCSLTQQTHTHLFMVTQVHAKSYLVHKYTLTLHTHKHSPRLTHVHLPTVTHT